MKGNEKNCIKEEEMENKGKNEGKKTKEIAEKNGREGS